MAEIALARNTVIRAMDAAAHGRFSWSCADRVRPDAETAVAERFGLRRRGGSWWVAPAHHARTRAAALVIDPPAEFASPDVVRLCGVIDRSVYPALADALRESGCTDEPALAVIQSGFAPDPAPKRKRRTRV